MMPAVHRFYPKHPIAYKEVTMTETLFSSPGADRSTVQHARYSRRDAAAYIATVRDLPHDAHSSPSAALAAIIGTDASARLLHFQNEHNPTNRPTLRELYRALREKPSDYAGVLSVRESAAILAALDIARIMADEQDTPARRITTADDAISLVCDKYTLLLRDAGKEFFYAILLDIRNKVIKDAEVSRGSVTASVVDPADIVREACVHHASRVVLVHNHPSGETDPSKEDIDTTNKITQALKYVGVRVLDHIIVGRTRQDFFSFAKAGMV
jgi:DNA repair protein RadC